MIIIYMRNKRKQQNTPSVICRGRRPVEVRDCVFMSSNLSGNTLEKGCLVGKCFDTRKNRTGILVDTSLGTIATKISIHVCHHF